jgi:hypothetical protein
MWTQRLLAAVATAVLAAGPLASLASAQATCDWYARTALKQQQENDQRKCGFKGPAWSSDLVSHTNWCKGVSPDAWKKQAQQRDQQLSDCAAKK